MSVKVSDQEFNIMLVKAVKKHPCLYNPNSSDYTRKDVVEQSWSDVSREVNEIVHTCKLRWKNIRTVFVRKLKYEKVGLKSKQQKPYYLRNVLQFLVPFLKSHASLDTTDGMEYIKIENNELEEDDIFSEYQINEALSNDGISETESSQIELPENTYEIDEEEHNKETENKKNCDPLEPNLLLPASKDRKRKKDEDIANDDDDDQFFEFCNRESHKADEYDPKKMFLLSILPEMHQMNDQQTRKFKRKMLEVIDDILEDKSL